MRHKTDESATVSHGTRKNLPKSDPHHRSRGYAEIRRCRAPRARRRRRRRRRPERARRASYIIHPTDPSSPNPNRPASPVPNARAARPIAHRIAMSPSSPSRGAIDGASRARRPRDARVRTWTFCALKAATRPTKEDERSADIVASGVRGMTPDFARDLASSPGAIARVDPSKGGLARFVTSSKPMWRCDA